jgi:hypothetical protein
MAMVMVLDMAMVTVTVMVTVMAMVTAMAVRIRRDVMDLTTSELNSLKNQ